MAETAHSPAPFQLRGGNPSPVGYVIYDAMGDSIGGLAWATGDHPPEEQLANARLFTASADLLKAARALVATLAGEPDLDPHSLGAVVALKLAITRAETGEP